MRPIVALRRRVVQAGFWQRLWWVFRHSLVMTYRDGCLGTAKAIAYSGLLAFFPMLTVVATILVHANAEAVSRTIARLLFEIVPPGTEQLVERAFTVRGERPLYLLIVAMLLSIWAAAGAMASLMEGFRAAYRIPAGRSAVKDRLVAILLVFFAALPVIGASALIVFGGRIQGRILTRIGVVAYGEQIQGWVSLLGALINYAVALATVSFVAALLYHFGPNRPKNWLAVWPGAMVATVLWLAVTSAFAWYVRNIADYNVLYGSIGAVIALLVWMYLLALVALIGCEFNAERERLSRIL